MATSLRNVSLWPLRPLLKLPRKAPDARSYAKTRPVAPPATTSRGPRASSPTALVRPSAPPGRNTEARGWFVEPRKTVPSVVEVT